MSSFEVYYIDDRGNVASREATLDEIRQFKRDIRLETRIPFGDGARAAALVKRYPELRL